MALRSEDLDVVSYVRKVSIHVVTKDGRTVGGCVVDVAASVGEMWLIHGHAFKLAVEGIRRECRRYGIERVTGWVDDEWLAFWQKAFGDRLTVLYRTQAFDKKRNRIEVNIKKLTDV